MERVKRKRRKGWSKVIEQHGVRVRLYERSGRVWRAVVLGRTVSANGKPRAIEDRKPLGHSDRSLAEDQAKALCAELVKARIAGVSPLDGRLTIGQLFATYGQHRLPSLSRERRKEGETRIALFLEAWGDELPVANIDQTRIEGYCAARRSLKLVAPAMRETDGKRGRGYRKPQPVRDGALDGELRWLNVVLNWGVRFPDERPAAARCESAATHRQLATLARMARREEPTPARCST